MDTKANTKTISSNPLWAYSVELRQRLSDPKLRFKLYRVYNIYYNFDFQGYAWWYKGELMFESEICLNSQGWRELADVLEEIEKNESSKRKEAGDL